MSEKEIVFNPNPFFKRAFYVEEPFVFIEHWVTEKFGFKAFKSNNKAGRWIHFIIEENIYIKATPEFLDDTEVANLAFSRIKERHLLQ